MRARPQAVSQAKPSRNRSSLSDGLGRANAQVDGLALAWLGSGRGFTTKIDFACAFTCKGIESFETGVSHVIHCNTEFGVHRHHPR